MVSGFFTFSGTGKGSAVGIIQNFSCFQFGHLLLYEILQLPSDFLQVITSTLENLKVLEFHQFDRKLLDLVAANVDGDDV